MIIMETLLFGTKLQLKLGNIMTDMTHPMIGDISDKSTDELIEILSKLNKSLSFASRTNNYGMFNQIQMAINTYRIEMSKREAEMFDDEPDDLLGTIDIS